MKNTDNGKKLDKNEYKPFPIPQLNKQKNKLLFQVLNDLKQSHEAYQEDMWELDRILTDKKRIKEEF